MQPKIALLKDGDRWGIPRGHTRTTHILKIDREGHSHLIENEHVGLSLVREIGLPAAGTRIMKFGGQSAIVVERFDRAWVRDLARRAEAEAAAHAASVAAYAAEAAAGGANVNSSSLVARAAETSASAAAAAADARMYRNLEKTHKILRFHQEDLCQALGLMPAQKYQAEKGPTPADIAGLLRGSSSAAEEDVRTFAGYLLFNWIIGATDVHAKNYALLHGAGGRVRLAPLYDVSSYLPYTEGSNKIKMAMKIGGEYEARLVRPSSLKKMAAELKLPDEWVSSEARNLCQLVKEACTKLSKTLANEGGDPAAIEHIVQLIAKNAEACEDMVSGGPAA